jgi:MFS family permease
LAPLLLFPLVVLFIPQPPAIDPPQAGAPKEVLPTALIVVLFVIAHVGMNVFYLMPVHVPFLLQEHLSTNAFIAGAVIASTTFASAIGALSFGRLRARFSSSTLLFAVFAIAAPGLFIVGNATSLPFVFAGAFLAGLGFGMQMPVLTTWISEVTPAPLRGRVLGGFSAAVFLGQFMSPLVTSPVVKVQGLGGPTGLFAMGALFSVVFAFAVLFVTRSLAKS